MVTASIRVRINDRGEMVFLDGPLAGVFVNETAVTVRASHVEPVNPILRPLFSLLRIIAGDKGRISHFTRRWACTWRVNLKPIGGPVLRTVYACRLEAIQAEIAWIEANMHLLEKTK